MKTLLNKRTTKVDKMEAMSERLYERLIAHCISVSGSQFSNFGVYAEIARKAAKEFFQHEP